MQNYHLGISPFLKVSPSLFYQRTGLIHHTPLAHGTGTRVGDALEIEGIRSVFGTRPEAPLILSSSKTVTGHCHGAAALVGRCRSRI